MKVRNLCHLFLSENLCCSRVIRMVWTVADEGRVCPSRFYLLPTIVQ